MNYRLLVGPGFAALALAAPSVLMLLSPPLAAQLNLAAGHSLIVQRALLTAGLSMGVVSCAFAVYHAPAARRILHLALFLILLELFYRFAYGGPVSPGILLAIPETSERETGELLAGHPFLTAGLTLVALLTIYSLLVSWRSRIRVPVKRCVQLGLISVSMIAASLAMAGLEFGEAHSLEQVVLPEVQATFPFDIATALGGVAVGLLDAHRLASTRASFKFPDVRRAAGLPAKASEVYVIVIGETSRRANWSLFGYPRVTTPRLDAIRDDLVIFKHVTSNATNTILSVPLALTRAAPATRSIALSERSIISLLNQAGFQTFWISNQARSDALSNPISEIAQEADQVSFPGDVSSTDRKDLFDSNLLTRLERTLAQFPADGKAVIFLHMEGSHFGYKQRYPETFENFREGRGAPRILPPRQLRLVDEYDNSVLFTDYVVRQVIDRLAQRGGRSGLIFFSDHGERLFDNGLTDGDFGHGFPTISRQEIDIPFFIWLSRGYRDDYPSMIERLKTNAAAVAQLHNLFETIVDLTGIDYGHRASSLSLFSDELRRPERLDVLNTEEQTVSLPIDGFGFARR